MATLTNTKIKDTYKSLLKVSDNGNLEAGLQEITDGEGNASGVQLNTGGDLTASGTVAFGSLKDSGENITITKFVDESDGIGSNDNDTSIPTSAAVKNYVDTNVTAQDLDFAGDSGTGAVDLDSQTFTIAGIANEIETSASGQTITIGLPNNVNVSGNLTVDTDTLYVAAAANRVGIGNSSPQTPFHLNSGGTQIGSTFESTSAVSSQINIKNANSTNGGFIKTTGNNIILSANSTGAEHLVVADGGNVGIGVSNPSTQLEIGGATQPRLSIISSGSTGASQINFGDGDDGAIGRLRYDHNGDFMAMYTNDSEAMRIDSLGNVLINTTTTGDALLNLGDRSQSPVRRLQLGNEVNFFTVAANSPSLQVGESQRLTFSFTNTRTSSIIELDVIQDYTASNTSNNHQSAKVVFHVFMTSGNTAVLNQSTLVSGDQLDLTDFTFTDNSNGTFTIDIINNLGDPNVTQYVGVKITGATCNLVSSSII